MSTNKQIESVNLSNNNLENTFTPWLARFIKTIRLEFDSHNLLEVDLTEMGLSTGLQDIQNQLHENYLIKVEDFLPKYRKEILSYADQSDEMQFVLKEIEDYTAVFEKEV